MKEKLDIKINTDNLGDMDKTLGEIKTIIKNHPEITEVNIEVVL